jgi:Zn-finger nucleic acid-binding protein
MTRTSWNNKCAHIANTSQGKKTTLGVTLSLCRREVCEMRVSFLLCPNINSVSGWLDNMLTILAKKPETKDEKPETKDEKKERRKEGKKERRKEGKKERKKKKTTKKSLKSVLSGSKKLAKIISLFIETLQRSIYSLPSAFIYIWRLTRHMVVKVYMGIKCHDRCWHLSMAFAK